MADNIAAVRAALAQAAVLAEEFMVCEASFYELGNTTPVFVTPCRVKKPRPSAFDAGNVTQWSTKRSLIIQIPLTAASGIVDKGLIVQVSGADDPSINMINFVVQSSLSGSFAAVRNVSVTTEVNETPRVS